MCVCLCVRRTVWCRCSQSLSEEASAGTDTAVARHRVANEPYHTGARLNTLKNTSTHTCTHIQRESREYTLIPSTVVRGDILMCRSLHEAHSHKHACKHKHTYTGVHSKIHRPPTCCYICTCAHTHLMISCTKYYTQ